MTSNSYGHFLIYSPQILYYKETNKTALYTLNKIYNWSLFKLIITDQAPITLKWILPKYVQFNGQKFSDLSEKLSFNPRLFC